MNLRTSGAGFIVTLLLAKGAFFDEPRHPLPRAIPSFCHPSTHVLVGDAVCLLAQMLLSSSGADVSRCAIVYFANCASYVIRDWNLLAKEREQLFQQV